MSACDFTLADGTQCSDGCQVGWTMCRMHLGCWCIGCGLTARRECPVNVGGGPCVAKLCDDCEHSDERGRRKKSRS